LNLYIFITDNTKAEFTRNKQERTHINQHRLND